MHSLRFLCLCSVNSHRCLVLRVLTFSRHILFVSFLFQRLFLLLTMNLPVATCSQSLVASNTAWAGNRQPRLLELQMSMMAGQGAYSHSVVSELICRLWGTSELSTGRGKGPRAKEAKVRAVMELTRSGQQSRLPFHVGPPQVHPAAVCPEASMGSPRRQGPGLQVWH